MIHLNSTVNFRPEYQQNIGSKAWLQQKWPWYVKMRIQEDFLRHFASESRKLVRNSKFFNWNLEIYFWDFQHEEIHFLLAGWGFDWGS